MTSVSGSRRNILCPVEGVFTKSQLDYTQNTSNTRHAGHPAPRKESGIAETNVARGTVDGQGGCVGAGRRSEDVAVGRSLDVNVAKGECHYEG